MDILESSLNDAIRSGNQDTLREILESNSLEEIETIFEVLNVEIHAGIIDLLLEFGIDINLLLTRAVSFSSPETIEILLNLGADVDTIDSFDCRPITLAIRRQSIEILNLLRRYNPEVNFIENGNESPLSIAVEMSNPEFVRILLEMGADPQGLYTSKMITPLMMAIDESLRTSDTQIVKLLLSYRADVNETNTKGETALWYGIRNKNILRLLLEYGVNPNQWEVFESSILNTPGYQSCVELLLMSGLEPNLIDSVHVSYQKIFFHHGWKDGGANPDSLTRTVLEFMSHRDRLEKKPGYPIPLITVALRQGRLDGRLFEYLDLEDPKIMDTYRFLYKVYSRIYPEFFSANLRDLAKILIRQDPSIRLNRLPNHLRDEIIEDDIYVR